MPVAVQLQHHASMHNTIIRKLCLCRYFAGPHICGDALDLDPVNSQILTGSFRKQDALEAISLSKVYYADVLVSRITGLARPSIGPSVI